jgi:hypothetical protein
VQEDGLGRGGLVAARRRRHRRRRRGRGNGGGGQLGIGAGLPDSGGRRFFIQWAATTPGGRRGFRWRGEARPPCRGGRKRQGGG